MKEYKYRLFYMDPPIIQNKKSLIHEFQAETFDEAYQHCRAFLTTQKEGTVILMIAQLDRG